VSAIDNNMAVDDADFGDFNANALYFDICSLSYNLFALMRQILPLEFANSLICLSENLIPNPKIEPPNPKNTNQNPKKPLYRHQS
jgi:hypothetical protein